MTLEEILVTEIERLEKNYGFDNRFILIGLSNNGVVEMCTTPMTSTSKEVILKRALTLP